MFRRRSDLEKVLAVAETGKIVAAAHRLAMTQPTLTRAIARLESRFGAPLFERLATGVRPTALGAEAAAQARRLLHAFEEAEDRIGGALAGRAEGLCLLEAGDSDLHCGGIDGRERLPGPLRREPLPAVTVRLAVDRLYCRSGPGGGVPAAERTPRSPARAHRAAHRVRRPGRHGRSRPDGVGPVSRLAADGDAGPPAGPAAVAASPGVRTAALSDRPGAAPLGGGPGGVRALRDLIRETTHRGRG